MLERGPPGKWSWHQPESEKFVQCSQLCGVVLGVSYMWPGVGVCDPDGSLPAWHTLTILMWCLAAFTRMPINRCLVSAPALLCSGECRKS